MKWKKIAKNSSRQPSNGCYSDWKEIIAKECFYQCIYCAIHESKFGGIRNFHVEHYRPKSKFPELENDIMNLFYACSVCNIFKSDDWPNEPCPSFSKACYPNPSEIDYSKLFKINETGIISGKYITSKYIIERLYLNRPQLIILRREEFISNKVIKYYNFFRKISIKNLNKKCLEEIIQAYTTLLSIKNTLEKIRPYETQDMQKKNNKK